MKLLINRYQKLQADDRRRGTAALEAAVCLPVLIMLVAGTIEMGLALRVQNVLQGAVRESGRLANIDWRGIVQAGDTPNAKVERDIRNFVTAAGFPGDEMAFEIVHAEGAPQTFDLSDPDNDLELFRINISLPYADVGLITSRWMPTADISATLVMRAGMGGGLSD